MICNLLDQLFNNTVIYSKGRTSAHDIATFAKESVSSHMQALDPIKFKTIAHEPLSTEKPWLIDFFAPVSFNE